MKRGSVELVTFGILCPSCGALLKVTGTLEEVEVKSTVDKKDILSIFPQSMRNKLEITIEGKKAIVRLKGKVKTNIFAKANAEVRGYGGHWVKGYFLLPIATFAEEQQ